MAVSNSGDYIPTGRIKFNFEELDTNQCFEPQTGTFKAYEDGLYIFFFNAVVNSALAEVDVYLNGGYVEAIAHNDDAGSYGKTRQLTGFWSMNLKANDEVYLHNAYSDSIYISDWNEMYFMGFRLNWF